MPLADSSRIIDRARDLLLESRRIVDGADRLDAGAPQRHPQGLLALYDELGRRLDLVDAAQVDRLVSGIAENVEELGRLAGEVERLRALRWALHGD